MGYGDEILAAGQAQRLYEMDPFRRVAICDRHNRVRWHDIWEGNSIIARPEDVAQGEDVQRLVSAPNARPYIVYPFTAESGWTFNPAFHARDHIARIYLTPAERARGAMAHTTYGPYILIEPWSKHENLRWPVERWHALVAACRDLNLTVVQHVHPETGVWAEGVHRESATFREACGLLTGASVYIRGESGMCHAAAALGVHQVTIWGGCMDWDVLGGYPRQLGVGIRQPPCGSWKSCAHCRASMDAITVGEVVDALREQLYRSEKRPPDGVSRSRR